MISCHYDFFSYKLIMDVEKTTMEYLFRVERQAEKILVDKSEIVALDKRRNNNRMAIRALINCKTPHDYKTWMAVGSCMVKVPIKKAKTLLEEGIFCLIIYFLFRYIENE